MMISQSLRVYLRVTFPHLRFQVSAQPPTKKTAGQIEKETLQFHPRAAGCGLSSSFGSSSSSSSIRLQGVSTDIVFDYEDEHDDEDDLNTLRMASQGGRPHFDFAIS
jgi:hypothetical protein